MNMIPVTITLTEIENVKNDLRQSLPDVKSSHRTEALARGLGWATNAAMRADLANGAASRQLEPQLFVDYLTSHGFETDSRPLTRAILRLAIRAVMAAQPELTHFGFGVFGERKLEVEKRRKLFAENRQKMLCDSAADEFERAYEFLKRLRIKKALNRHSASYGLKHAAESHHRNSYGLSRNDSYVSNGMLLAAAYHLGLKVQRAPGDSPNAYLNVSSDSINLPPPDEMSFKDYLLGRRVTDTPQGDFVGDAKRDSRFPEAKSWDEVEHYLTNRGACEEAIKAGKKVWRGYRRLQRSTSRDERAHF